MFVFILICTFLTIFKTYYPTDQNNWQMETITKTFSCPCSSITTFVIDWVMIYHSEWSTRQSRHNQSDNLKLPITQATYLSNWFTDGLLFDSERSMRHWAHRSDRTDRCDVFVKNSKQEYNGNWKVFKNLGNKLYSLEMNITRALRPYL